MTDTVVAEGHVKFRDGKKWKSRWVVLRKPSPVADCLCLLVYKEKKKGKEKGSGLRERLRVTLEGICGVEPGLGYDGVSYTFSILCLARTLVLGFSSRDTLLNWDARVRYSLGEVHRFSVNIEPGTKLESGPASLHLCNDLLVLTRGVPPVVIGHWKLSALRRYGAVPHGFVFEGGTRCGWWAGVFFLSCSDGEQISFLFDCIVRGITPSRAPHRLQPADPNADPASAERRISQEASELEKRLSMLSQCSLASSTASSYSCATSVAGDDHSSISSSSSSQSDVSHGSRLPLWVEPSARSHVSSEAASSSSTPKPLTSSDDRLYAAVMGGTGAPPPSAHLHPRGLSDSGRQSSLDSGIGIATGSHSSYSGSFSSCTESLDIQGAGEEFGSLASLPAPPSVPPPTPPPLQSTLLASPLIKDYSPAASSACPCASRSGSCASLRHSDEYQAPRLLRLRYDTPRGLLQTLPQREPSARGGPPELGRDSRSGADGRGSRGQKSSNSPKEPVAQGQPMIQSSHSRGSERTSSRDIERTSMPVPLPVPGGLVCGEAQCDHALDNYITPEQWWSVRNRGLTQVASSSGLSPSADTPDPPLCEREEPNGGIADKLAGLRFSAAPPLSAALSSNRTTSDCGAFRSPRPSASVGTERHSDITVDYVNIPISSALPAQTKPSSATGSRSCSVLREEGSNRCVAHLHTTAMETAQRVGAERVQGREDIVTQPETRRRGPPQ